jgi:hypothetical protein
MLLAAAGSCIGLSLEFAGCDAVAARVAAVAAYKFLKRHTNALPFRSERKGITTMAMILYCLSYTTVLLYFLPCASVPLTVTVRLLPSAATTTWAVRTTLPPFFDVT